MKNIFSKLTMAVLALAILVAIPVRAQLGIDTYTPNRFEIGRASCRERV